MFASGLRDSRRHPGLDFLTKTVTSINACESQIESASTVCRSVESSLRPDLKSERGASGQQNTLAIHQSPYYMAVVDVYTISTKKQVYTIRRTQPVLYLYFGAQRTFLQRKHKMPSRDCTWNCVMHGTSSTLK